ncbi:MAG: FHA domain-containing protein, partial [Synechococcales cyanobacterium CRU_2_2]|nr:FHA domain-containing protein [Synechococcales cyanobacterium CRU_2_2]
MSSSLRLVFGNTQLEFAPKNSPFYLGSAADPKEISTTFQYIKVADDKLVSRVHCCFLYDKNNSCWTVCDGLPEGKASTNGLLLNGRKLEAKTARLQPGDIVLIPSSGDRIQVICFDVNMRDIPAHLVTQPFNTLELVGALN